MTLLVQQLTSLCIANNMIRSHGKYHVFENDCHQFATALSNNIADVEGSVGVKFSGKIRRMLR
jgi:hypothetical protein